MSKKKKENNNEIKILTTPPDTCADLTRTSFWHFTTKETLEKILEGRRLRFYPLKHSNDINEKDNNIYVLCFCNANYKQIPMWYLYGGLDGKGAALGLTPSAMLEFLNNMKLEGIQGTSRKELNQNDYTIKYGWVFYQSQKKDYFCRSTKYTENQIKKFQVPLYLIKSYPWIYEKEFRIIITINTGTEYEYLENTISSFKKFKVGLGPENSDQEYNKVKDEICQKSDLDSNNIMQCKIGSNMNLVRKAYETVIANINSFSTTQKEEIQKLLKPIMRL